MLVLDPEQVRHLIESQFPELAPVRAAYLGEGCDSWAFDVNDAWVFRFPKRADVERQLRLETRVLPLLARRAPLPIPAFRFVGQSSADFPRQFTGYAKLPGVPAIRLDWTPDELRLIAPPLGRFLAWLHSFDLAALPAAGLETVDLDDLLAELQADALEDVATVTCVASDAPVDSWRAFLAGGLGDLRPARTRAVLTHSDLAAEHVLVDPATRAITGILDWSDMAIGDPALDVAGMFHWGGAVFARRVLEAYGLPVDAALPRRARFLAVCRGAADVAFGVERSRPEYIAAGLRALALCAT